MITHSVRLIMKDITRRKGTVFILRNIMYLLFKINVIYLCNVWPNLFINFAINLIYYTYPYYYILFNSRFSLYESCNTNCILVLYGNVQNLRN